MTIVIGMMADGKMPIQGFVWDGLRFGEGFLSWIRVSVLMFMYLCIYV